MHPVPEEVGRLHHAPVQPHYAIAATFQYGYSDRVHHPKCTWLPIYDIGRDRGVDPYVRALFWSLQKKSAAMVTNHFQVVYFDWRTGRLTGEHRLTMKTGKDEVARDPVCLAFRQVSVQPSSVPWQKLTVALYPTCAITVHSLEETCQLDPGDLMHRFPLPKGDDGLGLGIEAACAYQDRHCTIYLASTWWGPRYFSLVYGSEKEVKEIFLKKPEDDDQVASTSFAPEASLAASTNKENLPGPYLIESTSTPAAEQAILGHPSPQVSASLPPTEGAATSPNLLQIPQMVPAKHRYHQMLGCARLGGVVALSREGNRIDFFCPYRERIVHTFYGHRAPFHSYFKKIFILDDHCLAISTCNGKLHFYFLNPPMAKLRQTDHAGCLHLYECINGSCDPPAPSIGPTGLDTGAHISVETLMSVEASYPESVQEEGPEHHGNDSTQPAPPLNLTSSLNLKRPCSDHLGGCYLLLTLIIGRKDYTLEHMVRLQLPPLD